MKTFGQIIVIVLLTAFLSISLGGVAAQEPVTLNLWMFLDDTGFLPAVVEAFQAQNPHITVQITDLPEGEYVTKVDTALLAGEPPDIGFPYVQRWIKAGHLLAIDEEMAAQGINLDDYNYAAVTRNCMMDGHIYCLGSYAGGTFLIYNKDLFDAAGIPYPSPTEPMTIDEYANLVQRLAVPSDNLEETIWGGTIPQPWWFEPKNYVSEDGRTAIGYINDEATVHAYQVIADLYASGSALTATEESMVSANDLLVTGQLAMAISEISVAQLESTGMRWGATPPPVEKAGDLPWVYTASDEMAPFSATDHPDEAIQFVLFYGTEGNRIRTQMTDLLPLNMRIAEELDWAGDSAGRQEMLLAFQTARPSVFVPDWFQVVFPPLDEALNGYIIEDGLSAQEALDEAAPIVQDNLDLAWETWEQIQPVQ